MLLRDRNDKMVTSREAALFAKRIEKEKNDIMNNPIENIVVSLEDDGKKWLGMIYGLGTPPTLTSINIEDPTLSITKNPLEEVPIDFSSLNLGKEDPKDKFYSGEYLFEIILPPRYPLSPPDFVFLTPNGRFDINSSICFSNSIYHPDSWTPSWTIRHMLIGLLSFFLEEGKEKNPPAKKEQNILGKLFKKNNNNENQDRIESESKSTESIETTSAKSSEEKELYYSIGVGHINCITNKEIREYASRSKSYNLENHRERYLKIKQENNLP